jgi:hypothetical protein
LVFTVLVLTFLPLVAADFFDTAFDLLALGLPVFPIARSFCNLRARGLAGVEFDADIIDP